MKKLMILSLLLLMFTSCYKPNHVICYHRTSDTLDIYGTDTWHVKRHDYVYSPKFFKDFYPPSTWLDSLIIPFRQSSSVTSTIANTQGAYFMVSDTCVVKYDSINHFVTTKYTIKWRKKWHFTTCASNLSEESDVSFTENMLRKNGVQYDTIWLYKTL